MTYHISWGTKDGDQYEDEVTTLADVARTVTSLLANNDTEVTVRPSEWFDLDDDEDDDEPAWPRPPDSH